MLYLAWGYVWGCVQWWYVLRGDLQYILVQKEHFFRTTWPVRRLARANLEHDLSSISSSLHLLLSDFASLSKQFKIGDRETVASLKTTGSIEPFDCCTIYVKKANKH